MFFVMSRYGRPFLFLQWLGVSMFWQRAFACVKDIDVKNNFRFIDSYLYIPPLPIEKLFLVL